LNVKVMRVLGWGLTDLKYEEGKIVDPRINEDSVLLPTNDNRYDPSDVWERYMSTLPSGEDPTEREISKHADFVRSRHQNFRLSRSVTFEPQVCDSVLLLTPLTLLTQYKRLGDPLDAALAQQFDGNPRLSFVSSVTILDQPPAPYSAYFIDKYTGKQLDTTLAHTWRNRYLQGTALASKCREKGGADGHEEARLEELQNDLMMCTSLLKFDSVGDALHRIWGLIPRELMFMLDQTKLFTDRRHICDLVPMVYEINHTPDENADHSFMWKNHIPRNH
jgi:hypothetical protein